MPQRRYFLDLPFKAELEVTLPYPEAHHLAKVMRCLPGEEVELVNGKNQLAKATVLNRLLAQPAFEPKFEDFDAKSSPCKSTYPKGVGDLQGEDLAEKGRILAEMRLCKKSNIKKEVSLKILSVEEGEPLLPKVILCQAIPHLNRLEIIVEKGVELGMHALWLFPGERSEKKSLSAHQLKRLKAITISALKQCGRLDLPEILLKPPLSQWEELSHPAYFGDLSSEASSLRKKWQKSALCYFFIGTESGFTPHEIEQLHRLHVCGVSLHHNILRVETASIVALSQIFLTRTAVEGRC